MCWLWAGLGRREVRARTPRAHPQGPVRHQQQAGGAAAGAALTWGRACTTVSSRARIPVAIFNSFSTAGDMEPAHSAQAQGAGMRVCAVCKWHKNVGAATR